MLAGDPKQLDAVTKSEYAKKLGYKTSFMEHLFNQPCYQRDPGRGNYDPRFIVQLTNNYRSHPMIISMPNQLFYDGSLSYMAPKGN